MRRLVVLLALACSAAPEDAPATRALGGAPGDLRLVSVRQSLAGEHERYLPLAPDGTPVAGGHVGVHRLGGRTVTTANVVRPIALSGRRAIGADEAAARALAAAGGGTVVELTEAALPTSRDAARAGWRAVVVAESPHHEWEVWVDGERGDAVVRRDLAPRVDGVGMVYLPNPITTTGDESMVDGSDGDTAALTAARAEVTLRGLDGSGDLRGEYADVENKTNRANEPTLEFRYTRNDDRFEEVNAYFHIDRAQRHLQLLGYTGAKAILATPFHAVANGLNGDNSYYSPMQKEIQLGEGGVDDGEDGDVVVHEYGHAVLDDVIPGFGGSSEAGAIGEGFGDLLAAATPTGAAEVVSRACVAPWDAIAYTPAPPPFGCLRRVDGQLHYPEHVRGEVHDDGEIWSGAMWELLAATGLGPGDALALVVESLFLLPPDASFADSAAAIVTAEEALYAGAHAETVRRVLTWHGLLADLTPAAPWPGTADSFPVTIASGGPVGDMVDESETITHAGATAIRVHFSSFDMEVHSSCVDTYCDAVYLYDGAGRLYARLGGALGAFDAPAVPGDTVVVRWVSDGSVGSAGFAIDRYEISGIGPAVDAGPSAPDGGQSAAADGGGGPDGGGPGGIDAGTGGGEDSDCGCRVAGRDSAARGGAALAALALLLYASASLRRRRVSSVLQSSISPAVQAAMASSSGIHTTCAPSSIGEPSPAGGRAAAGSATSTAARK